MKKLLLATTALVSMFANVALADASSATVSVGGLLDFQAGFRSQKSVYKQNLTQNNKSVAFNHTAKIHAKAMGRADAGFTYGGVVALRTNVTGNSWQATNDLDKTYLFLESNLGRLELGSNYSASKAMKVDASNFARATGGVDGDWANYINTNNVNFMMTPDLASDVMSASSSEESRKITYYSPRWSGLQFGISYTPDTSNMGNTAFKTGVSTHARDVKNLVNAGLNYTQQFDQFTVALSATGETGRTVRKATDVPGSKHDLESYAVGANVSYANITVGGSYGRTNKKFTQVSTTPANRNKDTKFWTAGAAWVQGPFGASYNFFHSDLQKNRVSNHIVGVDYQLAPGMTPYIEASFFDLKAARTTGAAQPKNRGNSVIVGTQFRF